LQKAIIMLICLDILIFNKQFKTNLIMKKIILFLFIIVFNNNADAQFSVYIDNSGTPVIKMIGGSSGQINFFNNDPANVIPPAELTDKRINGSTVFDSSCKDASYKVKITNTKFGNPVEVDCKIDCNSKKIVFLLGEIALKTLTYKNKRFEEENGKNEETVEDVKSEEFVVFPLKEFKSSNEFKGITRNRIFIIDAKADKYNYGDETGLYKYREKEKPNDTSNSDKSITEDQSQNEKSNSEDESKSNKNNYELKEVFALPKGKNLSIIIKNYNFHDLESIAINIEDKNYDYEQDLKKIYDITFKKQTVQEDVSAITEDSTKKDNSDTDLCRYLDEVYEILSKYEFMNLNDLFVVEEYKINLLKYYNSNKNNLFGDNAKIKLHKIISWYPENLSLTPKSEYVTNKDEVNISYTIKNKKGNSETKNIGTFKTFGDVSVDYGAAFYLTDLRNNNVYTKTTTNGNNVNETKAILANSNNQSIGFGLNIDLSYRTGFHFRPTYNFGFFVPIEEEVSPFIATGPGIGFYSNNYKINLSWGLALGKVNSIKEEYKDVNLDGLNLTNTDLTEKVLKTGHYYSLSISFNVFNKSKK
jgi:hypothetical protein